MINEFGAVGGMEIEMGKPKISGKKPALVPLCASQITT
jgi:hypothetical protein